MQRINMIVAMERNGGIGRNNKMPWRLNADLKMFRKLTLNKCIVMGRKTFDSIGKPLPKRTNIVLTRNKDFVCDDVIVAHDVSEVLDIMKAHDEELFVCGGSEIYKSFMPLTDRLYVTMIHGDFECDKHFILNQKQIIEERSLRRLGFMSGSVVFEQKTDDKNDCDFVMMLFERNDI